VEDVPQYSQLMPMLATMLAAGFVAREPSELHCGLCFERVEASVSVRARSDRTPRSHRAVAVVWRAASFEQLLEVVDRVLGHWLDPHA
jgi:hypothetical protein